MLKYRDEFVTAFQVNAPEAGNDAKLAALESAIQDMIGVAWRVEVGGNMFADQPVTDGIRAALGTAREAAQYATYWTPPLSPDEEALQRPLAEYQATCSSALARALDLFIRLPVWT